MECVFSTDAVPEKDRFSWWQEEYIRLSGCAFDLQTVGDGPFYAKVSGRMLGDAALIIQDASPYTGIRSQAHIARSTEAPVMLALKLAGKFHYRCGANRVAAQPGDLLLFDASQSLHVELPHNHRTLVMSFPREALLSRLGLHDLPSFEKLQGGQRLGGLLESYLRAMIQLDSCLAQQQGGALAEHFYGLLSLALGVKGDAAETAQTGLKAARLYAIQEYLEHNLADPSLTPTCVAAHLHISTRYLHKLFEETGASFSQWLLCRRLEQCRRELADPAHGHRNISDIAFAWGFGDLSHFSRRFRAAFGLTPREWRQISIEGEEPVNAPRR